MCAGAVATTPEDTKRIRLGFVRVSQPGHTGANNQRESSISHAIPKVRFFHAPALFQHEHMMRLALSALLGVMALGDAAALADPSRGAQLYMRTDSGSRSCVSCHGPDPGQNFNNILRAADSPDTLTKVLNTVSAMGFLRAELPDTDRADITAFLGTVNRLNTPGAALRMWPVTADFGAVLLGGLSAPHTMQLVNPSRTSTVALSSLGVSGTQMQMSHDCPPVLPPSGACSVQLRYKPITTGHSRGALQLTSPAFPTPVYAGLVGFGSSGNLSQLEWSTSSAVIRFDAGATPPVMRRVLSLRNNGVMPAVLGLTSIVGPDAARFSIESGCSQGSVVQAATQCDMTLLFTPSLLPRVQATLQLRSDQSNPASLLLEGIAAPAPAPATPVEQLASGGSGGGCSVGPPGQRLFDPVLLLAAALAAWALGRRRQIYRP